MERSLLETEIKNGLSLRQLSKKLGKSPTTIRHWLSKFNLKTNWQSPTSNPKCLCGETNPKKFYGHRKTICGRCHNQYNLESGRRKRLYILEKLGGKCQSCGYDKYKSALDVHHLDPSIKDESFRTHRYWSYQRIDREISSCILLCRNCHQAHHSGELPL